MKLAASISAVLVFGALAQTPRPSSAPTGTATISGVVVSADTGQPLRRAQVRIVTDSPAVTLTATTDGDGRFALTGVPAGDYMLSASRSGYLEMVLGARRPGPASPGRPVRVRDGQKLDNVELRLPRGGVITGIITDEFGDPAFNVPVQALRLVYSNGERYATAAGLQAPTDDRGIYRIAGLMPGEYIVTAVPRDVVAQVGAQREINRSRILSMVNAAKAKGEEWPAGMRRDALELVNQPIELKGYVPVHYPGSVLPSGASRVRVGVGEEVAGIDIRLQVVQTANVTGTVTLNDGAVPAGARIQLLDPSMPMPALGSWWTGLQSGNRFTFYGVAPGAYVARVSTSAAGSDLFAAVDVHVNATRANDVELPLQRGMSVSGAVVLEGAPVTPARLRVALRPVPMIADPEMGIERVPVDAAGRFVFRGVLPARYRFQLEGLPAGWFLASAIFGGRDTADYLLEIHPGRNMTGGVLKLTSRTAEVSGTVLDAAGQPLVNAVVLLFPEDRQLWVPQSRRIHAAAISIDGRYAVHGLPTGDYRIAVADPEPGQIYDVEYLTQLLGLATPVTLAEGEKKSQDLRAK